MGGKCKFTESILVISMDLLCCINVFLSGLLAYGLSNQPFEHKQYLFETLLLVEIRLGNVDYVAIEALLMVILLNWAKL